MWRRRPPAPSPRLTTGPRPGGRPQMRLAAFQLRADTSNGNYTAAGSQDGILR